MNYRVILMIAGLMMNFAVFGLVMTIGAVVGDTSQWYGNLALGLFFTIISAVLLRMGMRRRKIAQQLFDDTITAEMQEHGYVDAQRFATAINISLDDARDVLDRRVQRYNWKRTDLSGYNAEYRPS